ncbi:MAG: hypothetical protein LUG50_04080 [Planctomycetaceae bacterium]|nr:hypothetical protein [Planctomycetaceae bacterium]
MGEAFGGLAKMGLIASVRHERSQRGERHGGFHQVWRVGDVKAARAYLSALVKSKDAITIIANKGKVR